jgi:Tfp pilus assembly protein PilV
MKVGTMKKNGSRRGFSLLEAIIAVGIFVASMAFIGQLMDVGLRLTDLGRERTQALLRCESTMEEIVAGIRRLENTSQAMAKEDPADPRWKVTVSREETTVSGLSRVTVRVDFHEDREASADDEPKFSEMLTRLVVERDAVTRPAGRAAETTVTLPTLMGLDARGGSR